MKSPILILLLIVNLLTCPVRCLSCGEKVTTGEECTPAACTCCQHDPEAPVSQVPEPCGDDCSCQNCICEGAVVEAEVRLPDLIEQFVAWVRPHELISHCGIDSTSFYARRLSILREQFLYGRDALIAYQSWLI